MPPTMPLSWTFLGATLLLLAGVMLADRQVSRRRAKRLRRLAERFGYRYSLVDRFRLARRLRDVLPADPANTAAGDVLTVRDLMYRREADHYVYAFTAVRGGGPRRGVVVRVSETAGPGDALGEPTFADPTLPFGEQYRRLLHEGDADAEAATPSPGTPGEGGGERHSLRHGQAEDPLPDPPLEDRGRGPDPAV